MTDLDALIQAVEAGQKMDTVVAARECFGLQERRYLLKAADGSLDAAKALHDALLPGWRWGRLWAGHMWVEPDDMPGRSERFYSPDGMADQPARAWLLATLKAYRASL